MEANIVGVIIGNKLWCAGNILREIVEKRKSTHGRLLEGKKHMETKRKVERSGLQDLQKETGWGGCYRDRERGGGGLFMRVSKYLAMAVSKYCY